MEHYQRLIFFILAIGWTLFRLLRQSRTRTSSRPDAAMPRSAGTVPQQTAAAAATPAAVQSPIEPAGGGGWLAGTLAAAAVLIGGNLVIWPLLFAVPALEQVPTMPRLVAGVLANLILLRLASAAAARVTSRWQPGVEDERNPIK